LAYILIVNCVIRFPKY